MSKSALTIVVTFTPVATTPVTSPSPTNTPTPSPTATTVPTPTATPIPTPTDTPIPTPTATPIPTPTNTPIPTATAIVAPTNTPTTVPVTPTTTVAKPTSTSVAGVPPAGGIPTVGATQQGTPTPTPSPTSKTPTPSGAGVPPTSTDVVPSPTASGYSTTVTGQNNGKMLLPSMPELAIGSSILGAAAVVGWFVWRRRQEALLPSTGPAQTLPAYDASPMAYAQTAFAAGNVGMVREDRAFYQDGTTAQAMTHMPETPLPHQAIMDTLEPSLETIMRQARTGLFALPDNRA